MRKIISVVALIAIVATSCEVNYKKTPSGLRYKIFSDRKNGTALKAGNFIKFDIEYVLQRTGKKDTVLNSTYGKLPGYTSVDTGKQINYSFIELLPKSKVGDSLVFIISIDSLKTKGMIPEYNDLFVKGSNVLGKVKIVSVFSTQEQMMKDYDTEMANIKVKEITAIESYLKKNNITAVKTKNGAYVEIIQQGTGAKADSGKEATVKYKGMLMDTKAKFDEGSIPVVVGAHRVIPGWEEALPYFAQGAKGKIYIPSSLGYGGQGAPPSIPPYSNLMFEVEIEAVKDAPAPKPEEAQMPEFIKEQLRKQEQQKQQQQKK